MTICHPTAGIIINQLQCLDQTANPKLQRSGARPLLYAEATARRTAADQERWVEANSRSKSGYAEIAVQNFTFNKRLPEMRIAFILLFRGEALSSRPCQPF